MGSGSAFPTRLLRAGSATSVVSQRQAVLSHAPIPQGQSGTVCGIFPPVRSLGPRHSHRTRRRHHNLMPRKVGESPGPITFRENPSSARLCGAPGRGGGLGETLHCWQRRASGGGCRLWAPSGVPGLCSGSPRWDAAAGGSRALRDSSVTPPIRREAVALQSGAGKQEGKARKSGSGAAFSRPPAGNPDRRTGWSKAARAGLRGRGGTPRFPAGPPGLGVRGSVPRVWQCRCRGIHAGTGTGTGRARRRLARRWRSSRLQLARGRQEPDLVSCD